MRKVVITGASKGIGLAIANLFCQQGEQVLITSRSEEKLKDAVRMIRSQYPEANIEYFVCDAGKKDDLNRLAEFVQNSFDGCDILVNNAGIFFPGSINHEEEGNYQKMMSVNMESAYHLTRALLPDMMEKKSGDIVNICSIASNTAYGNGGSYSISKFAMLGFSKNLREELKPYGIRVISVLPGATFTDSWAGADIDESRLMPAEDIASLVVNACNLSRRSVVEEIIVRPQLGDL